LGTIAILKFPKRTFLITKLIKARKFLKQHNNVKTVLEKTGGFSGELRTQKTNHLAGIKTKETTYFENNCTFKFNVDETYFSPRLSEERKKTAEEISKLTKKNKTNILIMFSGISPYPIILAKKLKEAKKEAKIYSNELNKKANGYAEKNIQLNKLTKKIELVSGDAEKLPNKISKKMEIILMTRPNLKKTFLKTALKLSKKGTTIFYHGFGTKDEIIKEIKKETPNKIGKITIRKAGNIGKYKFRWLAKFKVI